MKMRTITLIVALAFLLLRCYKQAEVDAFFSYSIYFKNESDYTIDIERYSRAGTSLNTREPFPLEPGGGGEDYVHGFYDPKKGKPKLGRLIPYCTWIYSDSVRIYFHKGMSDERYVTYTRQAFKPRALHNPDEYVFERVSDTQVKFYYTFTEEDYENAIKNQNATPTPIDIECD